MAVYGSGNSQSGVANPFHLNERKQWDATYGKTYHRDVLLPAYAQTLIDMIMCPCWGDRHIHTGQCEEKLLSRKLQSFGKNTRVVGYPQIQSWWAEASAQIESQGIGERCEWREATDKPLCWNDPVCSQPTHLWEAEIHSTSSYSCSLCCLLVIQIFQTQTNLENKSGFHFLKIEIKVASNKGWHL